jgi:hypothetical protein
MCCILFSMEECTPFHLDHAIPEFFFKNESCGSCKLKKLEGFCYGYNEAMHNSAYSKERYSNN